MIETILLLALVLALVGIGVYWRRVRLLEMARARLAEPERPAEDAVEVVAPEVRPFVRRHWLIPWLVALAIFGVGYWLVGLPTIFAATFAGIFGLIGSQLEGGRVARQIFRMESQLADGIDLMVAALRAGAGTLGALDNTVQEAKSPLKPQLEEMLGRIRYGDDPQVVLKALEARVPLETFRLFGSALSVHWETGGSLAPTLATVGRVIRDRTEVTRRIRALTVQARASTYAVMGVTYFIGLIIWRNDPERMQGFLATTIGQFAVGGAILLQAVGLVWTAALSRLRY